MQVRLRRGEKTTELEISSPKSVEEILESMNYRDKDLVAAKVNGKLVDLSHIVNEDATIEPVRIDSEDGIHILRHSGAHILAQAVKELYPDAQPTVGPVTEDPPGFYYDIHMRNVTEEDLKKIEDKMREIVKLNLKISRKELKKDELKELFKNNPFKLELIEENVPDGSSSTIYEQGNFVDFCLGPHLPSTGYLRAFKILSVSNAYWRGNEKGTPLVRIYGTAFPNEKMMKEYFAMLEEAKRRDHRKLGAELDLFIMRPEYGPSFPIYTPKGVALRNELINYMKQLNRKAGYEEVWTPHAFKTTLWEKSGHMSHYRDNMFLMEVENEDYGMKPMNCPGHILIFQRKAWSYRDMPVRFSEFATVYRYEKSGVTSGLLRVRSLTQDDGHAFVRMDQIEEEVGKLIDIIKEVYYSTFGIKELKFKLSTRDENNKEKYTGSSEVWERATKALKQSLENRSIKYEIKEGEAAFYGPKIDVDVRDAIGRYWQLSTIQLDFFMPDKDHFDLKYNDENNQPQQPVMIHRAIYGSLDRFMGVIIEHFAGAFPLWISPIQVRVVNISEGSIEYSKKVIERVISEGIRVDSDLSSETINKKIREAHGDKIPYTIIIGDKEVNESKISVRDRKNKQKNLVSLEDFITVLKEEIIGKSLDVNFCNK